MKRMTILSAIFLLGMTGLMAQTPAPPVAPKANEPKKADAKPQARDEFVEAVNAALQSHPDIKAAIAEVLLAQAKLDQVKLKVTQQINALKLTKEEMKLELDMAKIQLNNCEKNYQSCKIHSDHDESLNKRGVISIAEVTLTRNKLSEAESGINVAKLKIVKLTADIARLDAEINSYKNAQTVKSSTAKPAQKSADPKVTQEAKEAMAKEEFVIAVNAALQSHPDIKAAEAEVLLAQAKLDQVKLKVTQQINALKQTRDGASLELEQAKTMLVMQEKSHQASKVLNEQIDLLVQRKVGASTEQTNIRKQLYESEVEIVVNKAKIQKLSAEIARLDAEINSYKKSQNARGQLDPTTLKMQFTDDINLQEIVTHRKAVEAIIAKRDAVLIESIQKTSPKTGGVYDILRQVLGNPVKFGPVKDMLVQEMLDSLIKSADIPLKIRNTSRSGISLPEGEMRLSAWFELILDEMGNKENDISRYDIYIREYGLLLTSREEAPSGTITVREFLKQIEAEEAEAKKKEQPKK